MDGFPEWARRHCTTFGLLDVKHVEMVASWQRLFDLAGYSAADLSDATDWLAIHAPPRYPGDHLQALTQRVRDRKARDLGARQDDDRPACVHCGGTGRLVVPHLSAVVSGRWVGLRIMAGGRSCRYTCAVLCRCERGRFLRATDRNGNLLMSLDDYELANPGWRQAMAAEVAEREAINAARPGRSPLDDLLESLRQAHTRQPGDDDGE